MRSTLLSGASRFAHLSGISLGGRRRGARAEDDDKDQARGARAEDDDDDDKDDEPKGRRSRAEGDDKDDKDEARGSRAEGDDEDKDDEPKGRRSSAEDDDDDKDDEPKGRRSRAQDDDDDKDEMNGRSAAASARLRERERCAAIFASPHAAGNVELASSLAFETTMTRKEAIAVLKSQAGRSAPAAHDVRDARRARNPDLGPGGEQRSGAASASASWDRALAKAGVPGPAQGAAK